MKHKVTVKVPETEDSFYECASLLPETDGDIGGTYRDKIKEHFGVA